MEIWKDTIDFGYKYEVSNEGRIRSKKRTVIRKNGRPLSIKGKLLKYYTNKDGYLMVELHDEEGKNSPKLVHKVVWESFNDRVPEGFEIGHHDCNGKNSKLSNLYLCTHQENCNHPITRKKQSERMKGNTISKGLISKNRIRIVCLNLDYSFIKEYESITMVKEDGFNIGNVSACCNNEYGKRKNVTKGKIFMKKSDYENLLRQKELENIVTT